MYKDKLTFEDLPLVGRNTMPPISSFLSEFPQGPVGSHVPLPECPPLPENRDTAPEHEAASDCYVGDECGLVAEILRDLREAEERDARLVTKAYAHLHDVTHGATGGDWSWEGEIQSAHSLYHPDNLDQLESEGRKRKKQEPTKAQESKDQKTCPTMEAPEASAASRNDGNTDSELSDLARFNCREDHSWFHDYLPALEAREREAERSKYEKSKVVEPRPAREVPERVASDSKRTAT